MATMTFLVGDLVQLRPLHEINETLLQVICDWRRPMHELVDMLFIVCSEPDDAWSYYGSVIRADQILWLVPQNDPYSEPEMWSRDLMEPYVVPIPPRPPLQRGLVFDALRNK